MPTAAMSPCHATGLRTLATDYEQQVDQAQDYAERRGIGFRARVAQVMRCSMSYSDPDAGSPDVGIEIDFGNGTMILNNS